jgi:DNA-binding NarL/FixJ family response regulator
MVGAYDEAARLLRQPVGDGMFHTRYGLHHLHARGHYYLATGAYYAALGDFLHCGQLMSAWDMDLPALVPWRSSAAAAWAGLGNRSEALALVSDELALVSNACTRSRGIALRAQADMVDPPVARELLTEAVDIFAMAGDRFQHAHSLAALTRCLKALGNHSLAEMTQRRANEEFAKNGYLKPRSFLPPHDEKQAQEHDNSGLQLSKAEFRVASMAADGYTNREIAAKLFITMSTVEQHLTRIYRKLSISRRTELAGALDTKVACPA